MRRVLVGVVLTALLSGGAIAAGALTANRATNRGVTLFVGDSNITLSAGEVEMALTFGRTYNYVPVFASRVGATLRAPDCLDTTRCTTYNYWKLALADVFQRVKPDVIVNNLGINDTSTWGTATTPGWAHYGRKVDWFMNLVGGRPVLWTTLPCAIEPPARYKGCVWVNSELNRADKRWPNLTVLALGYVANSHPGYMRTPGKDVHYSPAGETAYARFVAAALDARFAPQ
jgi:hypothetical protein